MTFLTENPSELNPRSFRGATWRAIVKVSKSKREFHAHDILREMQLGGLGRLPTPQETSQIIRSFAQVENVGRRRVPNLNTLTIYRLRGVA